ncbi:MAG: OadG family protein [Porticoccus sp.]|nr:OadG family protein [Porticoccus sp.]MBQ0806426.1 OadG family protein [Porticoccus sp.]
MTDPLLQQGLDLVAYGMSTVFLFLTLLVLVTIAVSAIIGRCDDQFSRRLSKK